MAAPWGLPTLRPVHVNEHLLIPLALTALLALAAAATLVLQGVSRSCTLASVLRPTGLAADQQMNRADDPWPLSRTLSCGNGTWQREYAALHARMLRREVPPRYIVAIGKNGLADSFNGAMTLFFTAVLQRRAFFMNFGDSAGAYEWAFNQPNINWTWDDARLEEGDVLKFELHTRKRSEPEPIQIRIGDVRLLGAEYTTLYVRTFVGYLWHLMDNTHHKEQLLQMGLDPYNAMSCGVDFLFRMKPEALAPHAKVLAQLSNPAALKIGLQIRVGDQALVKGGEHPPLDFYAAFFDCAAQLEAHRVVPGQAVRWYLLTDSVPLRQQAKARFGNKLVTSLNATVAHTRKGRKKRWRVRAFQTAAAEMFMMGLTDYQIITSHSGFGRMGAVMSGKYHQVYEVQLRKEQAQAPANISCGVDDYVQLLNNV